MSIIIFLLVLVVLILVHEFGHFIIAKRSGIRVDEFGIGFPPRLFGKKYGETLYSLNALPFGGFVKIFGEDRASVDSSDLDLPRAMFNKSKWAQAAVLVGGVSFNILFAWFIFSATFVMGTTTAVTQANSAFISDERLEIIGVLPESPAGIAGLQGEDIIVGLSTDTSEVSEVNVESVATFIVSHGGSEMKIDYERDGELGSVDISTALGLFEGVDLPAIGVSMADVGLLKYPIHIALWEGIKLTAKSLFEITVGILSFLGSALLLNADLSQVAGPVGIVSLVGDASALGLIVLLNFTAFISLNLAVINLLPFPALDGGRLLFLIVEAIKGSPINPRVSQITNGVGFALLLLLMLVVTYGDVIRIIK
ncbi:MAG: site-2 protease family protein [Parcubacteria group bacterium]|nr:site-2 protease family protein [Parcubacteria group bacterium]